MFIFKCGFVVLPATYILSLCFQITQESNSLDTGLAFLYIVSGAIAGKILYDRYQQIHILSSLTPNPNETSFANKIASISASLLSLGFLVYFMLFLFKVDRHCLMALSIFIFGFSTLYLWMQCLITTYLSTLFYDQYVSVLRQGLANLSFLLLITVAVFGVISTLLPKSGSSGVYASLVITSFCNFALAAIFCVYILSFEKEYKYFSEGLRSEFLLDDACTLSNASSEQSLFATQEISNKTVIKGNAVCAKMS